MPILFSQFVYLLYPLLPRWIGLFICIYSTIALSTPLLTQGQVAFQQGQFEQAIAHWQKVLVTTTEVAQQVDILLQLASAYQALGLSKQAQATFLQALPLTQQDKIRQILVLTGLSDLALATRQDMQARHYADKSRALLSREIPALIQATVFNNLGNVLTVEAYYAEAIKMYTQCIERAQQAQDMTLVIRALLNKTRARSKAKQWLAAFVSLQKAQAHIEKLSNRYEQAFSLISVGELAQQIQRQFDLANQETTSPNAQVEKLHQIALTALTTALETARTLNHNRLISYAYGYLGQLYETEQRYSESLKLTRQAIFYAQQEQALDILYRWQWQLGRLFKGQKQWDAAIKAYRRAIETLQPIRQEVTVGYRNTAQSFREAVGPVYFELADLLLKKAKAATDKTPWLKETYETIERMKTAELQDYFRDNCVKAPAKRLLLDEGITSTAIIYPILLPDRIEILLGLPKVLQQFTLSIPAERLKDEVNEFRFELESDETNAFLAYAQRLYHWLIAPFAQLLVKQAIDTLVIVPDGVLRTIPFAALHDGQHFLIEHYAIVTTPSLTLTDPTASDWHRTEILLSGLSKSVQGYAHLSSVRHEVTDVSRLYDQQATVLLDQAFTVDNFANALENKNYTIVHIASHGQFDSYPYKTFVLTYEGQLTIDRLEQLMRLSELRREPVELLTLSACQTAVGDDQAALGLAGVAIKAGARSALATLWAIDDEATAKLVNMFYRQLKQQRFSKAKALQSAQKYLLTQSSYQHPVFWAAFLLIGNWL